MGMKKGQKQYGQAFKDAIKKLIAEGLCHREIATELGVELKVIRKAVERENKKQRQINAGILPKKKGKSRITQMTSIEELQKRNKELEMENELLKKFREELRR